jgi:hypothetical protein
MECPRRFDFAGALPFHRPIFKEQGAEAPNKSNISYLDGTASAILGKTADGHRLPRMNTDFSENCVACSDSSKNQLRQPPL